LVRGVIAIAIVIALVNLALRRPPAAAQAGSTTQGT